MIAVRLSMGCLFAMLAVTKVRLAPGAVIGNAPIVYGALTTEVLLALLFWLGRLRIAAVLGCAFFGAGLVWASAGGISDCTCLGGWVPLRGRWLHALAASFGGALCAAVWAWHSAAAASLDRGACRLPGANDRRAGALDQVAAVGGSVPHERAYVPGRAR